MVQVCADVDLAWEGRELGGSRSVRPSPRAGGMSAGGDDEDAQRPVGPDGCREGAHGTRCEEPQ